MPSFIKFIHRTYKMAHPHDRKVVLRNTAFLSVLQVITYILPLIIIPYLFRALGPDKFGLIAFAQAFVQCFIILTDYGFSISATKEISLCRNEHGKICKAFSLVMTVKIFLVAISLVILSIILYFVPKFRADWLVYVFSFGTVVGTTIFPVWFFQGTEKMDYITNLNIIGGVILAPLIFIFVKTPDDYLKVPLINSSVVMITGLLGQYMLFSRFRVSFKFQGYRRFKEQLKSGWDVFISIAAINVYTSMRVFILGLLTNNSITGLYSIAERIANACQTFPLSSFSQAIFPRLSKIFHRNNLKAFEMMRRIQKITTFASLLILPMIIIFAEPIVKIACGETYIETIISLQLLIFSVFFIAANAFRIQFLLVCGRTDTYSRIHVTAAIIGLPLIFLLINSFSYAGAAAATVAIEAGIFLATYYNIRKLNIP